jgi:hypothetical protein
MIRVKPLFIVTALAVALHVGLCLLEDYLVTLSANRQAGWPMDIWEAVVEIYGFTFLWIPHDYLNEHRTLAYVAEFTTDLIWASGIYLSCRLCAAYARNARHAFHLP